MTRVLHLYSNWKWTGPADHALNLVSWLSTDRDLQTFFACGRGPKGLVNRLRSKADERRIPHADDFFLNKHLNYRIVPDIFLLKRFVVRKSIDLIHSHQDNDALTAVLAGLGDTLVYTCYDGEPGPLRLRRRFILRNTSRIMTTSFRVQAFLSRIFPEKWIQHVDIPVDLEKFRPAPKSEKLCLEFGITTDEPISGIVARVQRHKNFSLLLDALEEVVREIPQFKFLIIGRGSQIDTLARRPVIQRGLHKNVIFTGYRGDDYTEVLNLLDYKVFLHAGSDGSCRAVREALACGKPVVALKGGILPELIGDEKTGILVDEKPRDLAKGIITMFRDNEHRLRCSRAARKYAEDVLRPERYVRKVLACYETLAAHNETFDSQRTVDLGKHEIGSETDSQSTYSR
ncbi:MAG: glycosyltransferase family 4 protein [Thermodesulfobacteriota bacterium]|nr:glycosyltransferase family 4 protein [Thermodesulfobacteriota bacterium]